MKKLLFLAIPFLLFGFSSTRNTSDAVIKDKMYFGLYCLKSCSSPVHYEVRVPSPPGTTYFHVDGVLTATGGRIFYVPKSASVFTFSTLMGGNYAMYDGGNVSDLQDLCEGDVEPGDSPVIYCN